MYVAGQSVLSDAADETNQPNPPTFYSSTSIERSPPIPLASSAEHLPGLLDDIRSQDASYCRAWMHFHRVLCLRGCVSKLT
jgi:hypothetical protein